MTFVTRLSSFSAAFAMTVLLLASPVQAQWGTGTTGGNYRAPVSTAEDVAVTQRWLSADPPSAEEWARQSKEYQEANDFDRQSVLEEKKRYYIEKFRLFAKPESLVINTNVYLSPYSEANKGFVIESFNDQTFFAYSFAGQDYAIVVPKIVDYKWLGIEGENVQRINTARVNGRGVVNMLIEVEPKTADKTPMTIGDKTYRLMSAEVVSLTLYAQKNSDRALWSRNGTGRTTKARGDLMNFYGK